MSAWNEARARHPGLPKRPAPSAIYVPHLFETGAWQTRIGRLMPGAKDHWWGLTPGEDLSALAADVLTTVRDFALPAIEAHLPVAARRDVAAR